MLPRWYVLGMVFLLGSGVWGEEGAKPAKPASTEKQAEPAGSISDRIAAIKKEHQQRRKQFYEELRTANGDNKKIIQANQDYHAFTAKQADQLMGLIRGHQKELEAFEGMLALVTELNYSLPEDLRQLLLQHHLANPQMGALCFAVRYHWYDPWPEQLLKETAAKHPLEAVRGQAVYALGDYFRERAQPPQQQQSADKQAKFFAEAARYYTEVTKKYAEVCTPDGRSKLGEKAAAELIRIRNVPNLKVGKQAPDIEGEDLHGEKMRLRDFRGKVVLLDFWGHW